MKEKQQNGLVVACYTPGDYEREAKALLIPSLQDLKLAYDVREIAYPGSWIACGFACQRFLLAMHDEMPDTDFLFMDVDATIHKDPWPYLRTLDCDIACHLFKGTEILTGTMYLPATECRRTILTQWVETNRANPTIWDQRNLQALLARSPDIRFFDLPVEYCCIFDTQRKLTPGIVPVIEHFQASRRYRRRDKNRGR